jgi:hypothetical protein
MGDTQLLGSSCDRKYEGPFDKGSNNIHEGSALMPHHFQRPTYVTALSHWGLRFQGVKFCWNTDLQATTQVCCWKCSLAV